MKTVNAVTERVYAGMRNIRAFSERLKSIIDEAIFYAGQAVIVTAALAGLVVWSGTLYIALRSPSKDLGMMVFFFLATILLAISGTKLVVETWSDERIPTEIIRTRPIAGFCVSFGICGLAFLLAVYQVMTVVSQHNQMIAAFNGLGILAGLFCAGLALARQTEYREGRIRTRRKNQIEMLGEAN